MLGVHGVKVSRWSMAYFAVAVGSVLLAEILLATGLADPVATVQSGWSLAALHLTTVGWLTILILGALQQFVPVLTVTELTSQRLAGVTLGFLGVGLAGLVGGFIGLAGGVGSPLAALLPWGGACVMAAVLLAGFNLGGSLARSRPWTLSVWFIATGMGFLWLTVGLGLTFALALTASSPTVGTFADYVLARGLPAHIAGGLVGWLTLTAMGVSYKLLAMFALAPEHRSGWAKASYGLTTAGVALVWAGAFWPRDQLGAAMADVGWAFGWLGLAAFVVEMERLFRQRKRRHLELNARAGRGAVRALAALLVAALVVHLAPSDPRASLALGFYGLYGWLGGLGWSQLYKIVPFLTWIERWGHAMGRTRTPRVQDLVVESRDRWAFMVYHAAILAAAAGLALGSEAAFRIAMGVGWLCTLDIARALWRARYASPSLPTARRPGSVAWPNAGAPAVSPGDREPRPRLPDRAAKEGDA
ncbi:MAG: hypothetical protein K6U14_03705 [Firmicutes bacterium]|nr:hypothetical protein [Alicyclobacillaceae bacterium]MCL6496726.1 hypothetical protein [Bacillota bacterium]